MLCDDTARGLEKGTGRSCTRDAVVLMVGGTESVLRKYPDMLCVGVREVGVTSSGSLIVSLGLGGRKALVEYGGYLQVLRR
jgi:hypothetical protein